MPMTMLYCKENSYGPAKKEPAEIWEWQKLLPWAWAAEPDPSPAMPQRCHGQLKHSVATAQLQASNAAKSLQTQQDSRLDSTRDLPCVIPIPVPQTPPALPVSQAQGRRPPRGPALVTSSLSPAFPVLPRALPAQILLWLLPPPFQAIPPQAVFPLRLPVSGAAEPRPGRMRCLGALQEDSCAGHIPREPPLIIPSILTAQLRPRGRTRWPGPPPPPGWAPLSLPLSVPGHR